MLSPDAITIGLLSVAAGAGALLAILCLEPLHRADKRRAYLDGWRAGHARGREGLFPHRMGGDHG